MSLAIQVRDLMKTYRRGVRALDGLSFSVPEGTLFGLLGPNGAGKSTAVRILSTLSRPDSGDAIVAGHNVLEEPSRARSAIGLVGQRLSAVPTATVRENIQLQGRMYGLKGRTLTHRVNDVVERLALGDVARRQAGFCSGGMRRRVDIAMGIVHQPQVLYLDEPTTGLDPDIRVRLWHDLSGLVRDQGMTILLTTHYLEEADVLADEVAIIDQGRLVTCGTPEVLKQKMRGDTLEVELSSEGDGDAASGVVGDMEGVSEVVLDGRRLWARAEAGGTAVPSVLGRLAEDGVAVASVTVSRPTLDDVYLAHTGRRLSDPSGPAAEDERVPA